MDTRKLVLKVGATVWLLAASFLVLAPSSLQGFGLGHAAVRTVGECKSVSASKKNWRSSARSQFDKLRIRMMTLTPEAELDTQSKRFESAPVNPAVREFLVNGWRWHTRVAVREAGRFRAVASKMRVGGELDSTMVAQIGKCYDFVWSFVFIKLHMIEIDIFFPWLRLHLPEEVMPVLKEYEKERKALQLIGAELGSAVKAVQRPGRGKDAMKSIADLSGELERRTLNLQKSQEGYLMPYVAAYVPRREQKKFNNKVISRLGILDSQILMVSMYDTIRDQPREYAKFKHDIPGAVRALIPTWRRAIVRARTMCLEPDTSITVEV